MVIKCGKISKILINIVSYGKIWLSTGLIPNSDLLY